MSIPAPRLLSCLLLAIFCTWLAAWRPFSAPEPDSEFHFLRFILKSAGEGVITEVPDSGHGYPMEKGTETSRPFHKDPEFKPVDVPLRPDRLVRLKIIIASPAEVDIAKAQICDGRGAVLLELVPRQFVRAPDTSFAIAGDVLRVKPATASGESHFNIALPHVLILPTGNEPALIEVAIDAIAFSVLFLLLIPAIQSRWNANTLQAARAHVTEFTALLRARPVLAILAVSTAAVLLNEYPIVFCGRSLVSPSTHVPLLYETMPTLPGAPAEPMEETKFADTAATAWQNLPYSVAQSRSLFRDHETPLWLRYNSCGVTLLGQGQSMLGDPLHAITVLAHGAWRAWDIKFILAKILFAFASGLCAWEITRRLGLSCLLAASVVWIGFFAYRYNHCAIFSVCYAPLIMVPWLRLNSARSWRAGAGWAAALILADWMELNSGTAKESSMLLLSINIAGLLVNVFADRPWRESAAKIALFAWASALFLLLSAPFWLIFLDSLHSAFTIYEHAPVYQLQPGLALALFDGLFSQDFAQQEGHLNPSANFFILIGCLWLLAAWPECRKDRTVLALTVACLPPLALVFGVVPPQWISAIPFLGNIEHIHNTFGVVLIVLFPMLAAAGLKHCLETSHLPGWTACWKRMAIFVVVLFCMFLGLTQAVSRADGLLYQITPHLPGIFFVRYAFCLALALALLPWALRWSRQKGEIRFAGIACAALCLFTVHFRHGMYLQTKFDEYVMNPRTGFDLVAQSVALDRVKRHSFEPARVFGVYGVLWPGYDSVVDLEGISGPDALVNRWYRELYVAAKIERLWEWCLVMLPQTLVQEKPIYDFMNVRFYLQDPRDGLPDPPLLALASRADLDIFESKEVWPRAFFTDGVIEYSDADAFIEAIRKGDGRPFAAIQGHNPFPAPVPLPERKIIPAAGYKLTNNTTAFTIKTPGPGVVVLTEAYEEGNFQVTVNGTPTPYFRVNHAYKGIYLDRADDYRIQFSYWPKHLTLSLWIAAAGALLAGLTAFAIRKPPQRESRPASPVAVSDEQAPALAACAD